MRACVHLLPIQQFFARMFPNNMETHGMVTLLLVGCFGCLVGLGSCLNYRPIIGTYLLLELASSVPPTNTCLSACRHSVRRGVQREKLLHSGLLRQIRRVCRRTSGTHLVSLLLYQCICDNCSFSGVRVVCVPQLRDCSSNTSQDDLKSLFDSING